MFSKSPKDKFVEQAQDLAQDLTAAIVPHIERARDELAPRLADARDQLAPRIAEAREQVGPRLTEAREQLGPRLAEARDQLAPHVEDVRGKLVKGVAAATTAATAAPAAAEAKSRVEDAADAVQGESENSGGGKKKYLLLAGVLGLGAFAAKKLRGDKSSNWQTYAPAPPPATPPATTASSTTGPSTSGVPAQPVGVSADSMVEEPPVGASPGESLSDAAEAPHPVTTPDSPAENVDVTQVDDPDKR
jgi:hypothetical protein